MDRALFFLQFDRWPEAMDSKIHWIHWALPSMAPFPSLSWHLQRLRPLTVHKSFFFTMAQQIDKVKTSPTVGESANAVQLAIRPFVNRQCDRVAKVMD